MSTPRPSSRPERRRFGRRGVAGRLQDLIYGGLRWIGAHVRGFYAATGVFLLAGFMVVVVALALFGWLATSVAAGATQRLDQAVVTAMRDNAAPFWDWLGLAGAVLGSGAVMWVVLILGTVLLWRSRHHYSALLLWVALLGGRVLNHELKALFERPRPEPLHWDLQVFGRALEFPLSLSFPSGHATTAMVLYGTLAYLVARLEPTRGQRRATFAAAAFLVLLIGLSRIYLGVHYPSDVIAGYLTGLAWATFAALGIEAVRYFRTRKPGIESQEEDLEKGFDPIRETVHSEG